MLIRLTKVLDAERLQAVAELLTGADFVDGRLSAGAEARRVKRNLELAPGSDRRERLNAVVMNALVRHPDYQAAALPARVATPFYARYAPGMSYGEHVDNPVMGSAPHLYRADVAVTIFLNDATDYDGGELWIRTTFGDQTVKLPAGDAVLYPASSLHRVTEVTRGERRVAVTWVQSLVRDAARRELLYELHRAREKLLRDAPQAPETLGVGRAYLNLIRMWAET